MRNTKHVLVASAVAVLTLGISVSALAQQDRRAELMNPYNKGGVVRGLDRADQVAGDHGKQGRDNARTHKPGTEVPTDGDQPPVCSTC